MQPLKLTVKISRENGALTWLNLLKPTTFRARCPVLLSILVSGRLRCLRNFWKACPFLLMSSQSSLVFFFKKIKNEPLGRSSPTQIFSNRTRERELLDDEFINLSTRAVKDLWNMHTVISKSLPSLIRSTRGKSQKHTKAAEMFRVF